MTTPAPSAQRGYTRLIGLDLLRLLAVLGVIGHHMELPDKDWNTLAGWFMKTWIADGGLGVDLFFVLSGFLVSGLLFAEYKKYGEFSVKRFYIRRAWRIYPAFYTLIVFSYLAYFMGFSWKIRDRQIFSELFFLQNYQQAFWNHTWTLALEEHFYLLLPLLLLALVWRNRGAADPFKALPRLVAASSCLFLVVRIVNYAVRTEYSWYTHAWPSHLRMDSLFFGVGIAYWYHFHHESFQRVLRPWRYPLIALGVALFSSRLWAPSLMKPWYYHTLGFTQFYLAAAALLVGVLMCRIPENALTRRMAAVGAQSYSIYLWHMALMYWVIPHLHDTLSWGARQTLFLIGSLVIGLVMAKVLELPLLALRDRWYPSRTADQPAQVPTVAEPIKRAA